MIITTEELLVKENDSILDDIMSEFAADAPDKVDIPRELPTSLQPEVKEEAKTEA